MSITLGVGSRLPAYCTSMGRVLLAALPEEQAMACLKVSKPEALTRHPATELDALRQNRSNAQTALVQVNQELEEGLISMAAPIHDRAGRTVAALNISGQANRTSARVMQDNILQPLLQAAQTISRLLAVQNKG